jgi:hypothetical protein
MNIRMYGTYDYMGSSSDYYAEVDNNKTQALLVAAFPDITWEEGWRVIVAGTTAN